MINKFKYSWLFLFAVLGLYSCLETDSTITLSKDPTFVSLKFGENDSIPHIDEAAFTLELDPLTGDSMIVNLDSLPVATRIDSVFPTFKWTSTSSVSLLLHDEAGTGLDTIYLTGTDTIDFSRVISVTNFAENDSVSRTYPIKVNVHTVEGELYQWKMKNSQILDVAASQQKVICFKNKYLYYSSSGVKYHMKSSADVSNWTSNTISGLPTGLDLRNMIVFNDKLYLGETAMGLYSSSDGLNWSKLNLSPSGMDVVNLLFVLNSNLWAVVDAGNKDYHIASTSDGSIWNVLGAIPDKFPIGDFAAISFASRTHKPKALVLGGYDVNGNLLRNAWTTENGQYWVDFSIENQTLGSCSGATIVNYDDKLFLFGGLDANNKVVDEHYMYSVDEGLSWAVIDSTYNTIYDTDQKISYEPRSYQSAILGADKKTILLFGGKSGSKVFSDLWAGKLNRTEFLRQ